MNHALRFAALLSLISIGDEAQAFVNLGRLSIATVFRSDASPEVRNLFDGGPAQCKIAGGWVLVRFGKPVTVSRVAVVQASGEDNRFQFAVNVSDLDGITNFNSPLVAVTGIRTEYTLPQPRAVQYAGVYFYTTGRIVNVDEIEILGLPPDDTSLIAVTPPIGEAAMHDARARAAESARTREAGRARLDEMRKLHQAIGQSKDHEVQARTWLELNVAAEALAETLGLDEKQGPLVHETEKLGVTVTWCEPSGSWAAGRQGYEKYLELWPRGPQADEAWWRGRVESSCGDSEGTTEEYRHDIATYSAFLKQFPKSRHAAEAREALNGAREGLEKQLKFEREQKAK